MLHESWALSVEVVIGSVFLANQVGWLWPVPHVIIIGESAFLLQWSVVKKTESVTYLFVVAVCSRVSRYVARNLKSSQATWNRATQERISATSTMLSSVKTIKMQGLQGIVEKYILGLREEELDKAKRVRLIMAVYNASGMFYCLSSPICLFSFVPVIFLFLTIHQPMPWACSPQLLPSSSSPSSPWPTGPLSTPKPLFQQLPSSP